VSAPGSLSVRLWLWLGGWLGRKGQPQLAATCYRNGAAGSGRLAAEASFRLAKQMLDQGRSREAEGVCRQALAHDAGHARAWCTLGAALRQQGDMDAAREAYDKALALDPAYAQAWSNLGEWWLAKGDATAALRCLKRALELDPRLLEALNNRAVALYELGRFADAEAAARRAIEIYPDQAALHVNLGNVLFHTGKARPAVKSFRRALECDPACPEAHLALATLLGETYRLAEVLDFVEKEIAAKGESIQRLAWLAAAQQAQGNLLAAEATCRKILERQPTNVTALVTLAGCLSTCGDHRGAIELHEKALASNPQMAAIYSNIAFDATYLPDISAQEVYAYHREWSRRFEEEKHAQRFSHDERPRQPDRPLRIGYVSGDFGRHPVGFLFRDVMRHHDKEQFEIHCYSMMRADDEITVAIREQASAWHDVLLDSDDEVARKIYDDEIDILVDLSGHTAYNRLPAFALRPAPVQATWIGYFHSTGLDSIDYFITDPHTSPRGCGQLFSETPLWLPHSRFCYTPPDYAPEVAPPPVLERGVVTFGCFNRVEKLVEPVIAAWAAIVNATPGSRLLIKAGALRNEALSEHLRQRFAALGLAGDRLELRGGSAHPDMLAEYGDMDIALDPFPFNGGMTTLEALWMGVPVITLGGNSVVSRQTLSALENIGLPELAYPDVVSYIQGAIALAVDHQRVAELRKEIRPRMSTSPIRQAEQFTRDLEHLYRRMWHAWCKGERLKSDI